MLNVYGGFFWNRFSDNCFTFNSVVVFGAICIDVGVIRIFFMDVWSFF